MTEELRRALAAAFALGEQLLAELQGQPTEAGLAAVERLVRERGEAVQRAQELFRAEDRERFRDVLEQLLEQQRALDGRMKQWLSQFRAAADATRQSRATTDGVRKVLGSTPPARQIDVRR